MRRSFVLTVLLGLVASALAAGVVYEIEVTDHDASPPVVETNQMMAEGKNLAMGVAPGRSGSKGGKMIYRGDRREMVVVDHDEKSYVVMDEAAINQIAGQVGAAMQQMQEALKNVPESQREMVEKMMKERMPQQMPAAPSRSVRRTGELGTHAGYPCVKYEVLRDGQVVQELWVTDWSNIEGADEVREVFNDMAEFFRKLMEAISSAAGGFGAGFERQIFDVIDQVDGFPVVTRDLDGGELAEEAILRSTSRRTLDPDEFEPPAGYKRRSMLGQ